MLHALDKHLWIVSYLSRLYRWIYSWDIWWRYWGFYLSSRSRTENTVILIEGTILVLDQMAKDKHRVRYHNRSIFGMWDSHLCYINGCNRPAKLHVLYVLEILGRNRRIGNSHLPYSCAVSLRRYFSTSWSDYDLWRCRWMLTSGHSGTSREPQVFISCLLIPWVANVCVVLLTYIK